MHNRLAHLAAYAYTFGAPGHEKGPCDGISGRWKNKVDQCSSSSETQGRLAYTRSGYIKTVTDAWMALQYHFEREGQQNGKFSGRNPINSYQFFLYTQNQNPIQRPNESFQTMTGISSRYQFAVNGEGIAYTRRHSC